jgi:integral membrane protein
MAYTPGSDEDSSLLARIIAQLRSADSARPRRVDLPKIPGALRLYSITAYVTGTMLLLLVAEMIVKYGVGYSLYFGVPGRPGFSFVEYNPLQTNLHGVDISTAILIVHGWLYVIYLFADFRLWSLMRLSFTKFIQIALGGVVPFMSFIVEYFVSRQVRSFLATVSAQDSSLGRPDAAQAMPTGGEENH